MSAVAEPAPVDETTTQSTVEEADQAKSDTPKKKREKKTELAPGIALGSPLFNRLFRILADEAAGRENVCPLIIAQLATAWEAEVAIVIGENNPEYTRRVLDSNRDVVGQISLDKIKSQPLRTTVQVFNYSHKKRPSTKSSTGSDDSDESPSTSGSKPSPSSDEPAAKRSKTVDAEGNVIVQ